MPFSLALTLPTPGQVGMIALLVFGFGFVIFWHELGHFLAAKWVGIKVEQFAVGFGHAMFSWRKGIGFRFGNTQKDYRERAEAYLAAQQRPSAALEKGEFGDYQISEAAAKLGLGETEYRLNWIPLGGYVKMLGQDDLKPDAVAEDPRAYNKKSISARMLVISAGVIMNVILAAIGFMILFLIGFNVAPAWVGSIMPDSPAQHAGMKVGDRIIKFDGKAQEDFTKIILNMALVKEGAAIPMVVDRPLVDEPRGPKDFKRIDLTVTPARPEGEKNFLAIGFQPPVKLAGPKKEDSEKVDEQALAKRYVQEWLLIQPGDVITAINGIPVNPDDFIKFNQILQSSHGQTISLTIKSADGKIRSDQTFQPHFEEPFKGTFNLAGMIPRTSILELEENCPALGRLMPGDVIESMTDTDPLPNPSRTKLMERLADVGHNEQTFKMQVLRDGKSIAIDNLKATLHLGHGRVGLGVQLILDEEHTVVADVLPGSPADQAGLKPGDTILTLGALPVKTWYDVQRIIAASNPKLAGADFKVTYSRPRVDQPLSGELKLDAQQLADMRDMRYTDYLQLAEYTHPRQTSDPLIAAKWGATETRDFILQFYLTLRRMIGGSVSPSNMMGPVGIFMGGARFAFKGFDWLLWFLCMISANLAVVNFLPIPVVDGGQFVFLILEKIKGKPLSPRAVIIAQYVGLAFLAAVVLFVTYNDILRSY